MNAQQEAIIRQEFRACCQIISQHSAFNEYAKTYAKAGLGFATDIGMDYIKSQTLYILVNLSHARGDTAKHMRNLLKEISAAFNNK